MKPELCEAVIFIGTIAIPCLAAMQMAVPPRYDGVMRSLKLGKGTMSSRDNIERLITHHDRRLQILKEQLATIGELNADPKLFIEIENIEVEIKKLKAQLDERRVQVILQGDFSTLSETDRDFIIKILAVIMGVSPNTIKVYQVQEGSVIFELGIPANAVEKLRAGLRANDKRLHQLNVEKVILENESGEGEVWVVEAGRFDSATDTSWVISNGTVEQFQIPPHLDSEASDHVVSVEEEQGDFANAVSPVMLGRRTGQTSGGFYLGSKSTESEAQIEEVEEGRFDVVIPGSPTTLDDIPRSSPGISLITHYTLLGFLIEAGLEYKEGNRLLQDQQWSDGEVKLQEAVNIVGQFFEQPQFRNPFDQVNYQTWSSVVPRLQESIKAMEEKVQRFLGSDIHLPYSPQIAYQLAEARGRYHLAEGVSLLKQGGWRSYVFPFSPSRQGIITHLKKARTLFKLCFREADFRRRVWDGMLQATIYLFAMYLASPVLTLGGIIMALILIFYPWKLFIVTHETPTPTHLTLTPASIISQPISFTLHCADGKTVTVDDQEAVAVPIGDAVIIETNVRPRSVGPRMLTNDIRQFPYAAGQLGLDTVDFTFFTDRSPDEYTTKSLTIEVVPKGAGGLCYR
jgi:hypothetical protein